MVSYRSALRGGASKGKQGRAPISPGRKRATGGGKAGTWLGLASLNCCVEANRGGEVICGKGVSIGVWKSVPPRPHSPVEEAHALLAGEDVPDGDASLVVPSGQ